MSSEVEYHRLIAAFSRNLREIRNKMGLTQEELSAKCGFNYRFYQKLESGKHSPSLATLFRLSKALKVNLTELLKP